MKKFSILAAIFCVALTSGDFVLTSDSTVHTADEASRSAIVVIQSSTNIAGPWTDVRTNVVVLPAGKIGFFRLKIGL